MSSKWALPRGARVLPGGGVQFSAWAPRAKSVSVRVGRNGHFDIHPLMNTGEGVFEGVISGAEPGCDYFYRLDRERDVSDPVSRFQPEGVHGPSRVIDPGTFRWSDDSWTGLAMADLVIYELHVGTFSPSGDYRGVIESLSRLKDMGVTALELMPVAQFPGTRNWGYDGVFPYAPQNSYGQPDDLRKLVDAAHGVGLAVLLDVVYNHLGPEGNVLDAFGPYFTDFYRTPWGKAVNFDGPDSDAVRGYFIDNARYWISEFHMDGLRLDAVHAICDFSAYHILHEIADELHILGRQLGRRVLVIAESDLNDPRLVRPVEQGGYALDAVWSDDFHHAVHAAVTAERTGYYADFGGVAPIAKALAERYVLNGVYSPYRRRRHGAPAGDVPADRFVVSIQNHDQVGNRGCGERLETLIPFERRKLAAAMMLLSPYVPLLFMGEEYGETQPFLYFVSHADAELVEAVRRGRRREFESFGWADEVPDPQAEETFDRSRIQPRRIDMPGHAEMYRLYRDLLSVRRSEAALRPGESAVRVMSDTDGEWLVWVTQHRGDNSAAVVVANLGAEERSADVPVEAGRWIRRLSTDAKEYGGSGTRSPEQLTVPAGGRIRLTVGAEAAVLYSKETK